MTKWYINYYETINKEDCLSYQARRLAMVCSKNMTGRKIRAAVLRKKDGPLKIETLSIEGLQDTEVLIRTVASGVCHTDISMAVSYTHLRAHETVLDLVCRLL